MISVSSLKKLKLILEGYQRLPEYLNVDLCDVNTVSTFGDTPIHVACTQGSNEDLETLITNNADINRRGEHGYTPAHQAIEQGHLEILRILIKNGADLSIINDEGTSPKRLAELLGETRIISYIKSLEKQKTGEQ